MGAVLGTVCNGLKVAHDQVASIVRSHRVELRRADMVSSGLISTGGFAVILGVGGVASHKDCREFIINGVKYTVEMIKNTGRYVFNVFTGRTGYVNTDFDSSLSRFL